MEQCDRIRENVLVESANCVVWVSEKRGEIILFAKQMDGEGGV